MNSGLKQRLVGAVVLLAIAIIFVPSFLRERQVEPVSTQTLIPDRPRQETVDFESPTAPEGIDPAPEPEGMFVPEESEQPVADDLEQAQQQTARARSEEPEAPSQPDPEPEPSPDEVSEPALEEGAWVVQVASFRSSDSARNLRDRLQAEGHRAYMRSATTSAGEVTRVYIGPKLDRQEAENTKSAVDDALQLDSLILRFEP